MALVSPPAQWVEKYSKPNNSIFLLVVVLITCGAILHSAIGTRLDGFTLDEPYHIVAGVSYIQRGDFRINPEHPPLVKLWVGSIVSAFGFHLAPFREIHDKYDERSYTNDPVWTHTNNPEALQHHARVAMWIFNGLLFVLFALALRRVFGPIVALGALLFLAIDPTVAAHLPVVMTDLPISILCATAVVLAARAFQTWSWPDLAACSLVLGLALAAKHSAPVFCVILIFAGIVLAFAVPLARVGDSRWLRLAKLAVVFVAAVVILWGFYRFRFTESSTPQEVFNRPLAAKIADLRSPIYRFALSNLSSAHVLPRAYIWGLADTVRAGLEGRLESRLVFGRPYLQSPWYFFPSVILVKLPIGLLLLIGAGLVLFLARRLPDEYTLPAALVLFAAVCFLIVLIRGADYAGIRHALPIVLLLSIFAGFAVHAALTSTGKSLKVFVALAFVAAALSALPALRSWEYYNELVGGSKNAYLYFNDEGVDIYQRHREIARYYHDVLKPAGDVPFAEYQPYDQEAEYLGLDWIGRDMQRDEPRYHNPLFTGTIIVQGRYLGPSLISDWSALRAAKPVARFGDLFIFRGTYDIAPLLSDDCYYRGIQVLFAEKPDPVAAEHLFRQAAELYPRAFWTFIELGNIYLSRGSRDEARQAYAAARDSTPAGSVFLRPIEDQIRLLSTTVPVSQISPIRDPALE